MHEKVTNYRDELIEKIVSRDGEDLQGREILLARLKSMPLQRLRAIWEQSGR